MTRASLTRSQVRRHRAAGRTLALGDLTDHALGMVFEERRKALIEATEAFETARTELERRERLKPREAM